MSIYLALKAKAKRDEGRGERLKGKKVCAQIFVRHAFLFFFLPPFICTVEFIL